MDNGMQYNIGTLWQARDENGARVTFSVWAGRLSIAIFKQGASKPEVKEAFPVTFQIAIVRFLKQMLSPEIQPGHKIPFIQNRYDRNSKSFVKNLAINFVKTEKKTVVMEISTPQTETFKFTIRASNQYTTGEPVTDEVNSLRGVQDLIHIFEKKVPVAELLSTFNLPPLPNRNGNRGNGGPNRPHQTNDGFRKQQQSSDPFGSSMADDAEIF